MIFQLYAGAFAVWLVGGILFYELWKEVFKKKRDIFLALSQFCCSFAFLFFIEGLRLELL
jgi:hypothetical protein